MNMYRYIAGIPCDIAMSHVSNDVLFTVYLFLGHVYIYCFTVFFILCSSIVSFAPYITYNRNTITLIVIECEVNIANCQCLVLHCTTLYDYG